MQDLQTSSASAATGTLEAYFAPFRTNTIGHDAVFDSPYGPQNLLYADWITFFSLVSEYLVI